ncbi:MAG: sigma-70 family RNA polymerase sigma factor [Deltaproteobacteria bacterium]|nr:sigma-70 family RNA polymerase sigma factor [Deltaproteobacteria bacterium]
MEDHAVQNRFTAYLKVSVNHYRAQYIQRLRRQQQQEVPLTDHGDPPIEADFSSPEELLQTALSQLREQTQVILLEHILQDKPLTQIARELGMPYPTVGAIYRRALEKLRKDLHDDFY